ITSEIAGEKAQTGAIDLGITHKFKNKPITAGITAKNIGPGLKYINQRDPLPLSITLGMAYDLIPGFRLAMDVKRLIYDKENTISLGTEYHVTNGFFLRAGYMAAGNQKQKAGPENITGGVGIKLLGNEIDYAVSPVNELGDTQKISIKKKF
ncbi:MAG: hypothetical protein HY746_08960, partial [Elusimicrobia bacterium]|nr:hypothetical protein [Elusimicrobiota bacterium]